MKKVIKEFIDSCNNLAKEFADKHDLIFDKDLWIGNSYDMIEMSSYYISLVNIFFDIKYNPSKNTFFEWHDYIMEKDVDEPTINYNSWIMGLRPENLKDNK